MMINEIQGSVDGLSWRDFSDSLANYVEKNHTNSSKVWRDGAAPAGELSSALVTLISWLSSVMSSSSPKPNLKNVDISPGRGKMDELDS